ncbi:peptidase [Streptomyces sp. CB00316]|uniref:prepilin peptidase n=1 Tax=unclassified Streptomyces TaxID=2593676 RepID=UPI000938D4E2|nr:A24 family peptidase [Streptomyces sp. CB00316]OKJ19982.1 peptidase [Streptomyces sp. CB00316]
MDLVLLAVAAVWGGATGLLIPRAAYRFAVEPEEPWRTACPAGHAFTGPFGGWWGPARCTSCASRAQTSVRYGDEAEARVPHGEEAEGDKRPTPLPYAPGALAPLVTALACVALAAATGPRPELVGWLFLGPPAVLLATVDRRVHRLPDPLTLPLAAAAVLLLGGAALLPGHAGSWTSGLLGGLVLGGFYLLLFLVNPNGMGFGDVKLALALGVALGWYGWEVLFLGGFAGFLFGAAYGLGLVVLRRAGRGTAIPFGPFMIAGALTGVLLGALTA